MPISRKNPIKSVVCFEAKLDRAFKEGVKAYKSGKAIHDCPQKFIPKKGNSILYDSWVTGFRTAQIAQVRNTHMIRRSS